MSLSAPSKIPKETSIDSIKLVANSTFYSIKKNPAETLFYFGLALLLIGLPAGIVFPVQYYATIGILGGLMVANSLEVKNKK